MRHFRTNAEAKQYHEKMIREKVEELQKMIPSYKGGHLTLTQHGRGAASLRFQGEIVGGLFEEAQCAIDLENFRVQNRDAYSPWVKRHEKQYAINLAHTARPEYHYGRLAFNYFDESSMKLGDIHIVFWPVGDNPDFRARLA